MCSTSRKPCSELSGRPYRRRDRQLPGPGGRARLAGRTGDADLYVRFDAAPTTTTYDCRPYTNGSDETCQLDVPAGASQVFIAVNAYTDASFALTVDWVSPN